jgi:hypothetical protein
MGLVVSEMHWFFLTTVRDVKTKQLTKITRIESELGPDRLDRRAKECSKMRFNSDDDLGDMVIQRYNHIYRKNEHVLDTLK